MLTEARRFKSWILVRVRGRGPFTGSAWRVAAHIYRDRALNLCGALGDMQQDIHTWEEAYTALEQERDELSRHTAELRDALHAAEQERATLKAALETIRRDLGHVCERFDQCTHVACRDSFAAWHIANEALQGESAACLSCAALRTALAEVLKDCDAIGVAGSSFARARAALDAGGDARAGEVPRSPQTFPDPICPRCGKPFNNLAPGFSIVAGGQAVCANCVQPGEEIARAKSL